MLLMRLLRHKEWVTKNQVSLLCLAMTPRCWGGRGRDNQAGEFGWCCFEIVKATKQSPYVIVIARSLVNFYFLINAHSDEAISQLSCSSWDCFGTKNQLLKIKFPHCASQWRRGVEVVGAGITKGRAWPIFQILAGSPGDPACKGEFPQLFVKANL